MAKKYKVLIIICGAGAVVLAGYLIVLAGSPVTDTFTDASKIASRTNLTICNGQIKLAEDTWTTLNECNCNSLSGWYWATTNGRSACWSKTLADSVSWNKGAGDDTDNPGLYTCATDVAALKDRMVAAAAGEWYKIVSDVNSVTIDAAKNGSAGYSSISALAIADCLDGARDLCADNGCLGADVAAVNVSLGAWAVATGVKSALPYCADGACGTSENSDYRALACDQNSANDLPLNCFDALFYKNRKVCADGDANYNWAGAAYSATSARKLGNSSCSTVYGGLTSATSSGPSFRVVVRP